MGDRLRRRLPTLPALVVLVVLALAAACARSSPTPTTGAGAGAGASTGVATTEGRSGPTRSFALALGVDLDDPDALEALAAYDTAVIDGDGATAATVERLQEGGTTVLAYLSAGTVEPGRSWFATAQSEGWLLDHWDDWDEWYAEVSEPGMRDLVVSAADRSLAKGFDGLFLDNTDMVQTHPDQRAGMIELVRALDDLAGPDRVVWAQNGDPVEAGIADHLDGWNREDVSSTYDFGTETYVAVSDADHRAALEQLSLLHDRGLVVAATDYFDEPGTSAVAEAAEAACAVGAIPFASDIDLTRIPVRPSTCTDA